MDIQLFENVYGKTAIFKFELTRNIFFYYDFLLEIKSILMA